MNDKKTALLIMGSVRAGRVCHQVAQWVADLGHASAQLDVEIVDLKAWPLHLYREWRDKPAMLVTYGGHGGTKCAEQSRQVLGAVKTRLVPTAPALVLRDGVIRAGVALDPQRDFQDHAAAVREAFVQLAGFLDASTPQ